MKAPVKQPLKLMLLKDMPGLGALGDVVKVKAGYARNYLLPRGLAVKPSPDAAKRVDALRKRQAREAEQLLESAKADRVRLASMSFHIEGKAGEEGRLYGSVNQAMIAEALQKEGFRVHEGDVQLAENIKDLGIYEVPVKLHAAVTATAKIYVVAPAPEKAEKPKKQP